MKNEKGFTLVELLVSITIMGIILILVFPRILSLKDEYRNKKYEAYKDSVERSAKLYTDSNYKDMFGTYQSGCAKVKYGELKSSNLIRDIQVSDVSCSDDNETYVYVSKVNNQFVYDTAMICRNKTTNKEVYNKNISLSSCSMEEDKTPPTIGVDPLSFYWRKTENADSIKVTLSDNFGFWANSPQKMWYRWRLKGSEEDTGEVWRELSLKPDGGDSKLVNKLSGSIKKFTYPKDSGEYYLEFNVSEIKDAVGNSMEGDTKTTLDLQERTSKSYYRFDNTPPTCELDKSDITNGIEVSLDINDDHSGVAFYGISKEKYDDNRQDKISLTKSGTYKIYGYVKDGAGNESKCDDSYEIKASPTVIPTPSVPTCKVVKWTKADYDKYKKDSILPNSAGSREAYKEDTWYKYPVLVIPTGGGAYKNKYQIKVTGAATNVSDQDFTYRNILYAGDRNGTSYVQCRACNKDNKCSNYSNPITIRVDKVSPTDPTLTNKHSDGKCTTKDFKITAESTDSHSGINYYEYKKDDGVNEWKKIKPTPSGELAITKSYHGDMSFRACDKAENCSSKNTTKYYKAKNCDTGIKLSGTIGCKIRGNQELSGSHWTCDHGHYRDSWYRVYRYKNGELKRCSNSKGPVLACTAYPYGGDNGWYVINDKSIGGATTNLKWNGAQSKKVPSNYTVIDIP